MERANETSPFAPLPGDGDPTNPRLVDIEGLPPATVAVLEEAGYQTLDDIIDLDREDFLKLPGIEGEDADRVMAILNELTTDAADDDNGGESGVTEAENGEDESR